MILGICLFFPLLRHICNGLSIRAGQFTRFGKFDRTSCKCWQEKTLNWSACFNGKIRTVSLSTASMPMEQHRTDFFCSLLHGWRTHRDMSRAQQRMRARFWACVGKRESVTLFKRHITDGKTHYVVQAPKLKACVAHVFSTCLWLCYQRFGTVRRKVRAEEKH